jgi:hypothetical protein
VAKNTFARGLIYKFSNKPHLFDAACYFIVRLSTMQFHEALSNLPKPSAQRIALRVSALKCLFAVAP